MRAKFKKGDRVRYQRDDKPDRTCTGTVQAIYDGYTERWSDGELIDVPTHVVVEVDGPLPWWWPYQDSNRFAPTEQEVEFLA